VKKVLYILGEMTDEDIEWMLSAGRPRALPAGETLIRQGDPIDALYIVTEGLFDVTVDSGGGGKLAELGAGEVLGEISFVDARPPMATVQATAEGRVLGIPREALKRKLTDDVGFAARFYRAISMFLADRLRDTVSQMGYGAENRLDGGMEDELDLDRLETASRGGVNFERIVQRLREI